MTTCESDVLFWLLALVASGLLWVGWGLWALHQQRTNRFKAERAAAIVEFDAVLHQLREKAGSRSTKGGR